MGIRGLGHLAEPQIEALREENVQKPDPWLVAVEMRGYLANSPRELTVPVEANQR